jgi:hypothetical protein
MIHTSSPNHQEEPSVKHACTVCCALLFAAATLLAGQRNSTIGTGKVSTKSDGRILERVETTPERNPLPPSRATLEADRSKPIPHSDRITSFVRWTSTHPTSI